MFNLRSFQGETVNNNQEEEIQEYGNICELYKDPQILVLAS